MVEKQNTEEINIKQLCFQRIEEMIYLVKKKIQNKCLLLVMDEYNIKMIATFMKVTDLINLGVKFIEKLTVIRKKFPKIDAIYLMEPTQQNIDILIQQDFQDSKDPQYKCIHCFFNRQVEQSIIEKVGQNALLIKRIQTFQELNLDFFCKNEDLVSFQMDNSFQDLFKPNLDRTNIYQQIVQKLVTVMSIFSSFYSIKIVHNESVFNEISKEVSQLFNLRLINYIKDCQQKNSQSYQSNAPQITFLILDRTFDMVSPIIHNFNYQSILNDLLKIDNDTFSYQKQVSDDEKKIEKKVTKTLNDDDHVYKSHRKKHIAEVMESISIQIKEFHQKYGIEKKDQKSDLSNLIQNLPQYEQQLSQFDLHNKIIEECFKVIDDQNINEIVRLEQLMISGINSDGVQNKSSSVFSEFLKKIEIMPDSNHDKLRLTILCILNIALTEDCTKLISNNFQEKNLFQKLKLLGVDIFQNIQQNKKQAITKKIHDQKMKLSHQIEKNNRFENQRQISVLRLLIESVVDKIEKPVFLTDLNEIHINQQISDLDNKAKCLKKNQKESQAKQKIIVFVIGGLSYAELSQNYDKNILFVTTEIYSPKKLMQNIMNL